MLNVFHTLRQQVIKKDTQNYALSDYIAPKGSGRADYIGGFAVSHYFGISALAKDQVKKYAKRKAMTVVAAEKWLGPWLWY